MYTKYYSGISQAVSTFECLLQLCNIKFLHLHHGLSRSTRRSLILRCHHVLECRRHNLPGNTKLICQPSTLLTGHIAVFSQLFPEVVNLVLILAVDHQGHSFAELPLGRTAVESHEGAAAELKLDGHDSAGFLTVGILA
ncbi:hypothetical protein HG530_007591 [Fusarium avenaceum]|nr:hypothetical protein HG530_007591 [Fusarium avenaceum]